MDGKKELKFVVSPEESGKRIDKCIALELGEAYSRTYVKFLMDRGLVLVNGKTVKPHYTAKGGDEVSLEIVPQEKGGILAAENIPLNVIYEDESIIVVNKSPGMVVHPGAGNRTGTLANALLHHCGKLADTGDSLRPGIVHRLDKDTSGVIVVAKNEFARRSLSKQFQQRAMKKKYLALVKGLVELDNGVVEAPVARHPVDRKKMDIEYVKGRKARTVYHVIRRYKDFTLLELEPETGRTHQIRVHMKHLGHPVLGDRTYGRAGVIERHALHAEMLGFTHPDTGKYVEFHAPMPRDMQEVIAKGETWIGK
ncbi:MAG: RluA family pseudouridine synthase [Candidatus Omnitrophota bacterium]